MYYIDTSAILHAWNNLYPFHIFGSLWQNIDNLIDNNRLLAPAEVLKELERKDDDVYTWAKNRQKMFIEPNDKVQAEVSLIVNRFPKFMEHQSSDGIWADPYLIAHAKIDEGCLITGETKAGFGAKKIRIPNVCDQLNIEWIDILGLIRKERWSF